MCFLFVWFQIAAEAPVRDVLLSVYWYLVVCDEKDCVGGDHSALFSSDALRQSSKFVCRGCVPYGFMLGMPHQLSVVEVLSSLFISDELDAFAAPLSLILRA